MLNLFKFLVVVDFIKSNKKALFYIMVLIALVSILPYLFDDIFQFISTKDKAYWVFVKWSMLTVLIITIAFKCYKVFNKPALKIKEFLEKTESDNVHKAVISKPLLSKGEKIKSKYRVKK
jgi:hypothetical protein